MGITFKIVICGFISPAINDACGLTEPLGLRMAEFPLNPMYARMLLVSGRLVSKSFFIVVLTVCLILRNVQYFLYFFSIFHFNMSIWHETN